MATWGGWAEVKSRLVTAGGQCSITNVDRGRPSSAPKVDAIRFWYSGKGKGVETFGLIQHRVRFVVAILLKPGASPSIEAEGRLDERMEEAEEYVRAALYDGFQLGGNAISFDIDDSETEMEDWTGQNVLICRLPVSFIRVDQQPVTAAA